MADVVTRLEQAFADVAAARQVDERDLRAWVAWAAMHPRDDT